MTPAVRPASGQTLPLVGADIPPPVEQVVAPAGGLDTVAVDVGRGELAHLARRDDALRRPGERSVFFREGSCIFLLFDRTAAALRRINEELGLTVLLTERNVNFALHPASDIHVLEPGRIRLRGTAAECANNARVRQACFGA